MIELQETFDASAEQLGEIRRTVRGWLAPFGLAPAHLDDVVLAVNEAAALALLVCDEGSRLALELTVDGSRLTAQVTFWHSDGPMIDAEVSRPLLWVCALVPHVEIDSYADRTTLRMVSHLEHGVAEAPHGGLLEAGRERVGQVVAIGTRGHSGRTRPAARQLARRL